MSNLRDELVEAGNRGGVLPTTFGLHIDEFVRVMTSDDLPRWVALWGTFTVNVAVFTDNRLLLKAGATPVSSFLYTEVRSVALQQSIFGYTVSLEVANRNLSLPPQTVQVKGLKLPSAAEAEQLRSIIASAAGLPGSTGRPATDQQTAPADEGTAQQSGASAAPEDQAVLGKVGGLAFDSSGAKVGTVAAAFKDEGSGRLTWLNINTGFFWGNRLAPVPGAVPIPEGLRLSVTRKSITTSPQVGLNGTLTDEQALQLGRHYGLVEAGATPTASGLGNVLGSFFGASVSGTAGEGGLAAGGRNGGTGAPDPDAPEAGPTTFEVHILGPSGSGKTVYLASLHQKMRIRRPGLTFYLKSDHESSTYLNGVYNRLSDIDAGWPEASQGVHEWNFTTVVQSAVNDFEPLRFRYVDYPGGILTNPRATRDPEIQALVGRLRAASALLVLLDGQAMLALLEGDPFGQRYLSFDLTSSLEIAQQSRCPLHFVVTKWDLLESRHSLAEVRDVLMADDNFSDLVQAKAEDTSATIRLIPVSAVGPVFADPDPSGGMRKTGAALRPQNVELPMISVLPDFLQFAYTEIMARATAAGAAQPPAPEAEAPAGNGLLRKFSGSALRATLVRQYPLLGLIPPKVFDDALSYGERMLTARKARAAAGPEQVAADLMAARRDVSSDRAALDLLEQQCMHLIAEFEQANPASVLGGGMRDFLPAVGVPTPASNRDDISSNAREETP